MLRLLAGLIAFLAAYWLLLFFLQRAVAFPVPPVATAPPRPADARQVWLQTPFGRSEAWLLPPLVAVSGPAPLLLFAHGNGELIDYWPAEFDEPRRWGLAVLLVEYPGYGRSAGQPSRRTIQQGFEAAFDWALARPDLDRGRILLYGRSLGGGAVAALSEVRPAAALVLESGFSSTAALAARFLLPPFLVRDRYDNLRALRRFAGPKLILHGERDEIIPVVHGRRLADAAGVPLALMPCGHNDCERPWPQLRAFLDAAGLLPDATRLH